MSSHPSVRHPLFIVGMPRSGTSLLSRLLHGHSQWAIAQETHYFTRCWAGEAIRDPDHARELLDCAFNQPEVADMGLSEAQVEDVRRTVLAADEPSHRLLLSELLGAFAQNHDAPYWGEKTPAHVEYLDVIADTFPGAVFLVMMRDPRDVSLSLRKTPWNQGRTVFDHAGRWARHARLADAFRRRNADRVQKIKYETLIEAPEDTLREVCRFLGCDVEPSMLARQTTAQANVNPEREPWKNKALQPIDSSNKDKWRDQMPLVERMIAQWRAGEELERQGYPREDLSFEMSMGADLLRILYQTIRGKVRRYQHHVLFSRPAREMPWRSETGDER